MALGAACAEDVNAIVLKQIERMPTGGGYAVTHSANVALAAAVETSPAVNIEPRRAQPSYCSGATYLVLLQTLEALQRAGRLALDATTWDALAPQSMPDGQGLWGRWNANGPGTARLFYELGLGRNFSSFEEAQPGDFMKIFWTKAVGANERGHSVVYLGTEMRNGIEYVRFWSSNIPGGYGAKSVPRTKIAGVIFSRLENPQNFAHWREIPVKDRYLASLLSTESSPAEAKKLTGVRD